jgi:hypothetical protein
MKTKLEIKVYDLHWLDKQKWEKAEMIRVLTEKGLMTELRPFTKTLDDYQELAEIKLGLKAEAVEEITKPSNIKSKKWSIPSIGIDED